MNAATRKPITLHRLREMHAAGEKIAMLTCYDATFARVLDDAGVDVPAGRRFARHGAAGPRQHAAGDARRDGLPHALRGARQPHAPGRSPTCRSAATTSRAEQALRSAARADAGGRADGQARRRRLDRRDGALPRRARHPGVRAPRPDAAVGACARAATACRAATRTARRTLRRHARELAEAGAAMLVLELVPAALARELSAELPIPVDRHRRRRGVRRPGAGAARHARPHRGQAAALRAQLHGRRRQPSRTRCAATCAPSRSGSFPDDALHSH